MDKLIELISDNSAFQLVLIGLVLLLALMLVILFIQYNIDRVKGRHAKFLWFEVNASYPPTDSEQHSISAKNVNTGSNYGEIGDKYTGLKQREVTREDIEALKTEFSEFSSRYSEKLIGSHITLGFPGCKETTTLANQLLPYLQRMGYSKIQTINLQTFGVNGKKFGVSNAPDNSLMIEVFPADNVE